MAKQENINQLSHLTDKEREIVYKVLGRVPNIEGTWICHLDELTPEERKCYFEQLEKQPELKKQFNQLK